MRLFPLALLLAVPLAAAAPRPAGAVGCFSGAVAGGVAGHYAGHHGLVGAAAGCAVGHHMHKVQREREREEAARQHAVDSPEYRGDPARSEQDGYRGDNRDAGDAPR